MPELHITVREKIAQVQGFPQIVCGNSDYTAIFDFDGEWSIFEQKTVRLVWQDAASGRLRRSDVMFSGSAVQIPAVYDTDLLLIGVYAGDIRTTTPARIPCCGCITDSASQHPDLPEDVYAQLMRLIEKLTAVGFGAASDATMIYDGVNAGFVGKTEEVEE